MMGDASYLSIPSFLLPASSFATRFSKNSLSVGLKALKSKNGMLNPQLVPTWWMSTMMMALVPGMVSTLCSLTNVLNSLVPYSRTLP